MAKDKTTIETVAHDFNRADLNELRDAVNALIGVHNGD